MPQTEPAVAVTIAIDRDGEADIEMFSVDAVECSAKSIATAREGRVSNYLDVELSGGQVSIVASWDYFRFTGDGLIEPTASGFTITSDGEVEEPDAQIRNSSALRPLDAPVFNDGSLTATVRCESD